MVVRTSWCPSNSCPGRIFVASLREMPSNEEAVGVARGPLDESGDADRPPRRVLHQGFVDAVVPLLAALWVPPPPWPQ